MRDAKRIIAKASHRNDSDPCLDFSEFACGHFNAYKPPSERYENVGFENDFEAQTNDFMKKILREKIEEEEPKIFKLVKKYYQKCVNSTYVRTEGQAEFKSLLYEYGKFPIFENNWKPSDFNVTKALILEKEHLIRFSRNYNSHIHTYIFQHQHGQEKAVRNALRFEFYLSEELSSEIYNDFFEHPPDPEVAQGDDFVPIHKLDEYLNITSGLDWLEIIKQQLNDNDITNDTVVKIWMIYRNYLTIFDLRNRRKLANFFTIHFLFPQLGYFSVYPKPQYLKRSKNRFEICIGQMRDFVNFPLDIMFQLKYGKETVSKAFKEFIEKLVSVQSSIGWGKKCFLKDVRPNSTIIVGFPDELTSPKFLNKLYANLTLTEDEGLYEMSLKLKDYDYFIDQEENNLSALENLSENTKEIFKNCGKHRLWSNGQDICEGLDNSLVFKVQNTLYPLFHPQRPYYVNLAYFSNTMSMFRKRAPQASFYGSPYITEIDKQKHYLKYMEEYGPEQNLPGFLMSNQQMLEMIHYQTNCYKNQNGYIGSHHDIFKSIFNCPTDEETEKEEREEDEECLKIQHIHYD